MRSRQQSSGVYEPLLSGKIICGECGDTWKRAKLDRHFGFVCNTHIKDMNACSMKSIPEEPVKAAFATMMNKLIFGRNQVLLPFATMMKEQKGKENLDRLNEIDTILEQNANRRLQIHQFFTKGLLDPAVYEEENSSLLSEAERLTAEQDALSAHVSGNYGQQEALEKLLKFTAKGKMLSRFDDDLFAEHVDHVIVYVRTEIGLAMKCGPVFR